MRYGLARARNSGFCRGVGELVCLKKITAAACSSEGALLPDPAIRTQPKHIRIRPKEECKQNTLASDKQAALVAGGDGV